MINIQIVKVTIHLQFGNRFPGGVLPNAAKCGETLQKRTFLYLKIALSGKKMFVDFF